ncbi:small nuclear ribonucleoprotein [Tuber brumale]|nr:small nuclear ribonucleoprotein [Tuber brumale]
MSSKQQGKMINYRMRVTMTDGRQLTGTLLAFDKHMNVVLADTEEFRRIKRKPKTTAPAASTVGQITEEKRTLGLIILRGLHIVSLSVESPPPADPSSRLGATTAGGPSAAGVAAAGPGISRPAGRGLPIIGMGGPPPPGGLPPQMGGPAGLQGPMRNVGLGQAPPPMGAAPPPGGFPGAPPPGFQGGIPGAPPGFQPPPGFQGGRGFPPHPPGFGR